MLGELGINLGPLLAGAGIAGIALGFGAQSLVKDCITGIFMLIEDQFGVGDVVDVGEASGVVEAVSLRSTRLRDVNGTVWHVPNGEILRVGNKSQQWARAVIDMPVAARRRRPPGRAGAHRVADELVQRPGVGGRVLEAPRCSASSPSAPTASSCGCMVKTKPAEQWAVMRELRVRLKEAFDAEGIPLPRRPPTRSPVADAATRRRTRRLEEGVSGASVTSTANALALLEDEVAMRPASRRSPSARRRAAIRSAVSRTTARSTSVRIDRFASDFALRISDSAAAVAARTSGSPPPASGGAGQAERWIEPSPARHHDQTSSVTNGRNGANSLRIVSRATPSVAAADAAPGARRRRPGP